MEIIQFNGKEYRTAIDIQLTAMREGYNPPRDPSGRRHPGTDVNAKCRVILNDHSFCHHMGVTEDMGVDIKDDEFIQFCISQNILPATYSSYSCVTFYEVHLARAVHVKMLGAQVDLVSPKRVVYYGKHVTTERHNFASAKQKLKKALRGPSLLGGKVHG